MEHQIFKILESNYCGGNSKECKAYLTQRVKEMINLKDNSEYVISKIISLIKAGPNTRKLLTLMERFLIAMGAMKVTSENIDILVSLLFTIFLKLDVVIRELIIKDIENFFEKAYDIYKIPPSESRKQFKFEFWFDELLLLKVFFQQNPNELGTNISQKLTDFSQTNSQSIKEKVDKKNLNKVYFSDKEEYITYTGAMAKLYFKMLYVHNTWVENRVEKVKSVCEMLFDFASECNGDIFNVMLSALSSLFINSKDDRLLTLNLTNNREIYKTRKIFGEHAALFWFSENDSNFVDYFSSFRLTFEIVLDLCHRANSELKDDPKSIILGMKILQKFYPELNEDDKEQGMTIFGMMISTLSRIKNLTKIQTEFFLRQLTTLQNLIFARKDSLSINLAYINAFKPLEQNLVRSETQVELTSKTMFFKELITNTKLLNDTRFGIEVHKIMFEYMQIMETNERNFIQKLKDALIISWKEEFPEKSSHRMKYTDNQEGKDSKTGYERMMESYLEDEELLLQLSKHEIKIIITFLNILINKVIDKDMNCIGLAVNLLPEGDIKLSEQLQNEVKKEAELDNCAFTHMNFMIRSYKYYQSNRLKMPIDTLFNQSFMSMKKFLTCADKEQYIPDFVQVFSELLSRNQKHNDMNNDTLVSPMKTLFTSQKLIPNIISSLSYSFLLYSQISTQSKEWSFVDGFKTYFTQFNEMIVDPDSKEFQFNISHAKKFMNDKDEGKKSKCLKVFVQEGCKMYRLRNYVELIFECIEALMRLSQSSIDKISNEYVVIKPKYCNNGSEKIASLKCYSYISSCEVGGYANANLIVPQCLYSPNKQVINKHMTFTEDVHFRGESFEEMKAQDKSDLVELFSNVIETILLVFISMLKDKKNYDYFYGDKAGLEYLEEMTSSYQYIVVKAVSRALKAIVTNDEYKTTEKMFKLVNEIDTLCQDNKGKSIRKAFSFITNTVEQIICLNEFETEFAEFDMLNLNE